MFYKVLIPIRFTAVLCGALLAPSLRASESSAPVAKTPTEELNPFSHLAAIPANAELGTIRFEKIRKVKVPVALQH